MSDKDVFSFSKFPPNLRDRVVNALAVSMRNKAEEKAEEYVEQAIQRMGDAEVRKGDMIRLLINFEIDFSLEDIFEAKEFYESTVRKFTPEEMEEIKNACVKSEEVK